MGSDLLMYVLSVYKPGINGAIWIDLLSIKTEVFLCSRQPISFVYSTMQLDVDSEAKLRRESLKSPVVSKTTLADCKL